MQRRDNSFLHELRDGATSDLLQRFAQDHEIGVGIVKTRPRLERHRLCHCVRDELIWGKRLEWVILKNFENALVGQIITVTRS